MFVPFDAGTRYRKQVTEWACLWDADYGTEGDAAPAYTRSWGDLLAGLMQAAPVRVSGSDEDSDVETMAVLADLTDEGVPLAAGFGVVFLRPVLVGDDVWGMFPTKPTQVTPLWANRRLIEARVWDWMPDPRETNQGSPNVIVMVEVWRDTGEVIFELWEGTRRNAGSIDIGDKPIARSGIEGFLLSDGHELANHPWHLVIKEPSDVQRFLVPYVWKWDDGSPVPVFAGRENAIRSLARLWDQEQDDAELVRKRIIMPADYVEEPSYGWGQAVTNQRQWSKFNQFSNVLLTAPGMTAQGGPGAGIETVEFGDNLVMRDRIERRENSTLENIGINPQSIGRSTGQGQFGSDSAAAKRADQQMTMQTVSGPARRWEAALSLAMTQLARLNGDPRDITVDVTEGLKPDQSESADLAQKALLADASSTWERIRLLHPSWTDAQRQAEYDRMIGEGLVQSAVDDDPEVPAFVNGDAESAIRDQADALGVLIRAGVEPKEAAARVGLPGIDFTGAIPTSLRVPKTDATSLEG